MINYIVGLQKLSLLDYEGYLSAIIFTNYCNFNCGYCHNSDIVKGSYAPYEYSEVLDYLKERVNMLDAVVITGGEPLIHKNIKELLLDIKALGYKIKLDTNGTFPLLLEELISEGLVDYVAVDIKTSFEYYDELTCSIVDKDALQKTIKILKEGSIPYEFRTTAIAEYFDDIVALEIGKLLEGASKLYLQKFEISEAVRCKNLHHVEKEDILRYQEILKRYIKEVNLRGY